MYWVMRSMPSSDEDLRIYEQPTTVRALGLSFDLGRKILYRYKTIEIVRERDNPGRYTDNLLAYGVLGLVFNSKIRMILRAQEVRNIQYFRAVLVDNLTGTEVEDYQIANIVGTVLCIDKDASVLGLDEDDGSIEDIDKLVLNKNAIEESSLKIFRIGEYSSIVVVHDSIKKAFEAEDVTGVGFVEPEKFVL